MILTDTHAHLYANEFDADRNKIINTALEANVKRFFLPNIDSKSIKPLLQLADDFPENCFPMIGLHPTFVKTNYEQELKIVEGWIKKRKFYAIGEVGIDLYWDKTFLEQQQKAFEKQILWAKEFVLPIVIHCRNSFNEIMSVLERLHDDKLKGIFHCFTGSLIEAQQVIDLGFYLGIGGVVTFKNSGLDKVIEQIDLKHLVLETDSPYLTPVPYRGKRNESAYIKYIADRLAEIHAVAIERVADITTENSKNIFGI